MIKTRFASGAIFLECDCRQEPKNSKWMPQASFRIFSENSLGKTPTRDLNGVTCEATISLPEGCLNHQCTWEWLPGMMGIILAWGGDIELIRWTKSELYMGVLKILAGIEFSSELVPWFLLRVTV